MLGPASPIPTQCLLLKNMFNPAECALANPRAHCALCWQLLFLSCVMSVHVSSSVAVPVLQHELNVSNYLQFQAKLFTCQIWRCIHG